MEEKNPFKKIETDKTVPEGIKEYIIADIVDVFKDENHYVIGDTIKTDTIQGCIEAIDDTYITLAGVTGIIRVPIKEIIKNTVEIIKNE
ncbi:hypothetical protein GCM10022393_39460 [Aquimarina addita]|uniref:DUF4926 domain-containing protein n=1 Tax=Aquimarina addita TaxID=870485 RepID=A0ABP6UWV2_9FLAO